jgi:hypothetical protein
MIYPAWFELYDDEAIVRHRTALRVYAWLLRDRSVFVKPKRVTNFALAAGIHVRKEETASAGLSLLIERGYVTLCHRDERNARHVMVNVERSKGTPHENGVFRAAV